MTAIDADMPLSDATPRDITAHPPGLAGRKLRDRMFVLWGLLATLVGLGTLVILVWDLAVDGGAHLTWRFFTAFPSSIPEEAGILSAWVGSLLVILTTAVIAIPIGIASGLYLEEYAPKNPITGAIEIAVNNLASVPSIIYGMLALGLFVQVFALGQSILTAGMTLALLILPVVIVATREAVRSVPQEMRNGALAVGATKWQATQHHVLPYAMPGVVTGVIIGLSRAIGETAPLILIGGLTFVAFLPVKLPGEPIYEVVGTLDEYGAAVNPDAMETIKLGHAGTAIMPDGFTEVPILANTPLEVPHGTTIQSVASLGDAAQSWLPQNWLMESFTVMPIQMFNWTSRPEAEFREIAATAGLVLLAITLLMNGSAIWLRYRLRKKIKW